MSFHRTTLALNLFTVGLAWLAPSASAEPTYIWWEAENYDESTFQEPDEHPYRPYNEAEAGVLSEGKWIGVGPDREQPDAGEPESVDLYAKLYEDEEAEKAESGPDPKRDAPSASYTVEVPADGEYYLYVRKFWKHGPFEFRFNDGPWQAVPKSLGLLDEAPLRRHLSANWVGLGAVDLAAGKQNFEIRMDPDNGRDPGEFVGAFDAFVLGTEPFLPRGKTKPSERMKSTDPAWFAFDPQVDDYHASPVDMGRLLNAPITAESAWIRTEGENFVDAEGNIVRFFAANMGYGVAAMDHASMDYLADWLAKRGINMVRFHSPVYESTDSFEALKTVDPARLESIHYMVHAMRERGIYTTLSIYFPLWVQLDKNSGVEGYFTPTRTFGLQYFSPKFQEAYYNWWRVLLTSENPYTGIPLNRDPAVAIAELVNEDSYFFWTFNSDFNPPDAQMKILGKQFGDWLTEKYGSVQKALSSWTGGVAIRQHRLDDAEAGIVGILKPGELSNKAKPRAVDTANFLMESMRSFHAEAARRLREDFDFQGLIYGSNWKTANPRILGPLDKYANAVVDVMDRHGYYSPAAGGDPRTSHDIPEGSYFSDRALSRLEGKDGLTQFSTPLADITYDGLPGMITETGAPSPNRYQSQFYLPMTAYSALQGLDAIHWFALGGPSWQQVNSKFPIALPSIAGQFPGLSVAYRRGYFAEADPVIEVDVSIDAIRRLEGSPLAEAANFDQLRAADLPASYSRDASDPMRLHKQLAHYIGKVKMNFVEGESDADFAPIKDFYDLEAKQIRSSTGELHWDYGTGMVKVNAPKAQGATGFFADYGTVDLKNVEVASDLHTGAFLCVALDDRTLKNSRKMLFQIVSEDRNEGWITRDLGEGRKEIADLGGPPLVVRKLEGSVRLDPALPGTRVTTLDMNGYRTDDVQTGSTFQLRDDAFYYLIER